MSTSDAPPSYSQATGSKPGTKPQRKDSNIPPHHRRSMEDERRDLPPGWVRTYDPKNSHQFFVDTTSDPPRSIWHHPYDDEQYLSSISSEERERIESLQAQPTRHDIISMDTDEEDHAGPSNSAELPPRPQDKGKGKQSYGRRLKDKLTGTTHEEREQERQRRDREEEEIYKQHLHVRRAMTLAEQTGQPQFIGKDSHGYDVFLEPSNGVGSGYQQQGQMINPYASGIYQNPNARFIRPQASYARPYGYGYGGGMGMPLGGGMGMPLMGGLMGGALLGGLLF